jgi:hypothetical protein
MDWKFILKTPPAICIGGGILSYWFGDHGFGIFLIVLGAILQILWLIIPRLL